MLVRREGDLFCWQVLNKFFEFLIIVTPSPYHCMMSFFHPPLLNIINNTDSMCLVLFSYFFHVINKPNTMYIVLLC